MPGSIIWCPDGSSSGMLYTCIKGAVWRGPGARVARWFALFQPPPPKARLYTTRRLRSSYGAATKGGKAISGDQQHPPKRKRGGTLGRVRPAMPPLVLRQLSNGWGPIRKSYCMQAK